MNRRQRADRLVSYLRWSVVVVLACSSDHIPLARLGAAIAVVAAYNVAITWFTASSDRYQRYGRTTCDLAWMLDLAVISFMVGSGTASSLYYLLYCFVLVGYGYANTSLAKLSVMSGCVLALDAAAAVYSLGSGNTHRIADTIGMRSIVLVFGALVAAYIASRRSQDEVATDRHSYLNAIADYGTRLTNFTSVEELAKHVLESAVHEAAASGGQLLLVDGETGSLECDAFHPLSDPAPGEAANQEALMNSYAKWVVSTEKEFLVRYRGREGDDAKNAKDDRPAIAIPMLWQSEGTSSVTGVLVVVGYRRTDFSADALSTLRIFAAMSGAAIASLRLYTNLKKSFLRTLQTLANGLEARDEYTRGHSERVMQVACMIAEELELSAESVDVLRNASLLHDIGKIGVPDAVLRKAGKLTQEEWETMRRHPLVSEEICRPLGLQSDVLFLIRHHHERLDTKGYPSGLAPQDQPLLQRILVVADSFDAMRSRRPYRDIMPEEDLRLELSRCAGRSMDPTVTETLLSLMNRGELDHVYAEHDRLTGFAAADERDEDEEDLRKAA